MNRISYKENNGFLYFNGEYVNGYINGKNSAAFFRIWFNQKYFKSYALNNCDDEDIGMRTVVDLDEIIEDFNMHNFIYYDKFYLLLTDYEYFLSDNISQNEDFHEFWFSDKKNNVIEILKDYDYVYYDECNSFHIFNEITNEDIVKNVVKELSEIKNYVENWISKRDE